jgi:hypothetical protein
MTPRRASDSGETRRSPNGRSAQTSDVIWPERLSLDRPRSAGRQDRRSPSRVALSRRRRSPIFWRQTDLSSAFEYGQRHRVGDAQQRDHDRQPEEQVDDYQQRVERALESVAPLRLSLELQLGDFRFERRQRRVGRRQINTLGHARRDHTVVLGVEVGIPTRQIDDVVAGRGTRSHMWLRR